MRPVREHTRIRSSGVQRVVIHEVGMRDGLQMEQQTVPTVLKIEWIERLAQTGIDIVQVGSFVHPDKVPQMADTDALFSELMQPGRKPEGVTYSGLVLNEKGLARALACGAEMICLGVSASETHSRKNTGMSVAEATERILATAKMAAGAGRKVQLSVQSAFGCGYEGAVPRERVLAIVRRYLEAGWGTISLADTAGHAVPDEVERMIEAVRLLDASAVYACHFHNTYGLALANCCAAMKSGVTLFESSVAGLGGCPFTKIAGGNTCTEDFLHMIRRMGLREDVDLGACVEIAKSIGAFFGREMPGTVHRVGTIPSARP